MSTRILAYQCLLGRQQLQMLRDYCPVALGDSEYNRQELEQIGYTNTGVLPIQLHFEKFDHARSALLYVSTMIIVLTL